jgi:adenylate cyclase
MNCGGCGLEASPAFAFCPGCGRRLSAPPAASVAPPGPSADPTSRAISPTATPPAPAAGREADRRQVTIVFADLTGFTSIAERLDPEDVRAFQNALFERFARSIERFDGFVEKFVGDAVMAVFGAPVAHEDDPVRALEAALDLLAGAAEVGAQWSRRIDSAVTLHIGVHTGPVVAGRLGVAAGAAYAVTGDAVNTTARLLSAAAPGTILVSAATRALTAHHFAFEPAGELSLRGKSEAIVVHRLLGARAEPRSARGLGDFGLEAQWVGRSDELGQLLGAFDAMRQGRAQVVSLVGEAGSGKSRLVREFFSRLEAEGRLAGVAVRRVSCASLGEPPYGVFGALFRDAYQVSRDDSLERAQQKLAAGLQALGARAESQTIAPVLGYLLGVQEAKPSDVEPEQLQRQIALAARALVERRLESGPLLQVVDDLQWADAASVDLLRHVVDHLADRPIMVLLSHRTDARPPQMVRAAQQVLALPALSHDETRTLVAGLIGSDGACTGGLQEFVAMRAEGNPLFAEEIVRSLIGKGVLVREAGRWVCATAADTVDVPQTLHGLLLSRVDRLPDDGRRALQEAAVLGVLFDRDLLCAIATDPDATARALEGLVAAGLVQPPAPGNAGERHRFTHALAHEVVYQNLLLARRTELHERAGRALERLVGMHPQRLSDLEALGHHWSLAPDKAKGARYLQAAGDRARSVYANDDAIRHFERALRTLQACTDCEALVQTTRERLADLLALTGRREGALAHYESVLGHRETAGDRVAAARLQRKIGSLHWEAGDRERARACFAAGLDRLGPDGDAIERANLFQELGRLAFRAGDSAAAIGWAERALAAAGGGDGSGAEPGREHEAVAMRVQAFNTLGVALARTGRLQEAVAQIEQSIALAETRELLQAACRGYTNLSVLYSSLDPPRSIQTCLRGLETARKVGDLAFESHLHANLAVAYCALTDRCEAEGVESAQRAIDLDRRLGLLDHLAVPLIVLGQIYQCKGEAAPAFDSYREALGLAERTGEPQLLFPCYDGLATLYLDTGDQASAETYLVKAQEVCERAGLEPDALMVLPFLC